jgi:uncharacterized protein (DUF2461 family)
MLTENALRFLSDLSLNNDRDWFHANKARYEKDVKKPFEAFVAALIERAQARPGHIDYASAGHFPHPSGYALFGQQRAV